MEIIKLIEKRIKTVSAKCEASRKNGYLKDISFYAGQKYVLQEIRRTIKRKLRPTTGGKKEG